MIVTRGVMRALVPNLTAVLLVIHAMIGCCHHHWHTDGEVRNPRRSAYRTLQLLRVTTADRMTTSKVPGEPCNGERECQGVCTYLPTQRMQSTRRLAASISISPS